MLTDLIQVSICMSSMDRLAVHSSGLTWYRCLSAWAPWTGWLSTAWASPDTGVCLHELHGQAGYPQLGPHLIQVSVCMSSMDRLAVHSLGITWYRCLSAWAPWTGWLSTAWASPDTGVCLHELHGQAGYPQLGPHRLHLPRHDHNAALSWEKLCNLYFLPELGVAPIPCVNASTKKEWSECCCIKE